MRLALQVLPAVLIVALAAWLRLQRLDLVQFLNDEGQALLFAEDLVRLGKVPLVGLITSVGMQSPPTFIYVLAPVVALSRDPAVASGLIGLANVAAVGGVLVLAWRRLSWLLPSTETGQHTSASPYLMSTPKRRHISSCASLHSPIPMPSL